MTEDCVPGPGARILRWRDIGNPEAVLAALDAIFFEASGTKTFASDDDRKAFRERWLGRYLAHDPQWAYVALAPDGTPEGTVAGYLVAARDDPALAPRFADIGYFPALGAFTRAFPAHLHINLAPAYRGSGLGKRLIEAFLADAAAAGVPGVHVVTGRGMRNVRFYLAAGFDELTVFPWQGKELVMLGRAIGGPRPLA